MATERQTTHACRAAKAPPQIAALKPPSPSLASLGRCHVGYAATSALRGTLFAIWSPLRPTREEIKIKDNKIKRRWRRENIKEKSAALFMYERMIGFTYFKTIKRKI